LLSQLSRAQYQLTPDDADAAAGPPPPPLPHHWSLSEALHRQRRGDSNDTGALRLLLHLDPAQRQFLSQDAQIRDPV